VEHLFGNKKKKERKRKRKKQGTGAAKQFLFNWYILAVGRDDQRHTKHERPNFTN
jgi:hypothetical protein